MCMPDNSNSGVRIVSSRMEANDYFVSQFKGAQKVEQLNSEPCELSRYLLDLMPTGLPH